MRRLWRSDDPALRALVGHLALACTRPLADTPRLDDLCANGAPAISAADARAVDAVLRPDTPSLAALDLDDEPIVAEVAETDVIEAEVVAEPVVAFTLDDEPSAPRRPESTWEKRKPLIPVSADEEEDEPNERPRRRRRPPSESNGRCLLIAAAVVLVLLALAAAGVVAAAWYLSRSSLPIGM
jgi:hypothetical protein